MNIGDTLTNTINRIKNSRVQADLFISEAYLNIIKELKPDTLRKPVSNKPGIIYIEGVKFNIVPSLLNDSDYKVTIHDADGDMVDYYKDPMII